MCCFWTDRQKFMEIYGAAPLSSHQDNKSSNLQWGSLTNHNDIMEEEICPNICPEMTYEKESSVVNLKRRLKLHGL